MEQKFKMIDESFICEACQRQVSPLGYSARNHCPYCLTSKHVDINPGDRSNPCHGLLLPVRVEKSKKRDYKIVFKCQKCKKEVKNIMASDDNMDLIIKLSSNVI